MIHILDEHSHPTSEVGHQPVRNRFVFVGQGEVIVSAQARARPAIQRLRRPSCHTCCRLTA